MSLKQNARMRVGPIPRGDIVKLSSGSLPKSDLVLPRVQSTWSGKSYNVQLYIDGRVPAKNSRQRSTSLEPRRRTLLRDGEETRFLCVPKKLEFLSYIAMESDEYESQIRRLLYTMVPRNIADWCAPQIASYFIETAASHNVGFSVRVVIEFILNWDGPVAALGRSFEQLILKE